MVTTITIFYNDKGEKHIRKNNNFKRFALFLIILSVICTISCVNAIDCDSNSSEIISDSAPGELSEIYVSSDASDEIGDGSSQNPFKSLECAVNNSKEDSTIHLNNGEYAGDSNRNITIDKSITIIGKSKENTIINGESCGRLFNVTSTGRLTLIDVTLLNGYSDECGGLIYCDGGEINIKNCIIKNSSAYDKGGAIYYNNTGTLNIEDSLFINNSARLYGGVLYTLGTTSIRNSDFKENRVTMEGRQAVAGCIYTKGKIDLDGCLFYKCHSEYSAGALSIYGNATINNCIFESLTTNYAGGAISNHGHMIINNSYFRYNDVAFYAGAILDFTLEHYNSPGGPYVITEVYNSIFERNHAGIHAAVSNNFPNTYLYMQNCALLGNYLMSDKEITERYGDVSLDDNATLQYCWWGQNEISPYYYSPHSDNKEPEKINASRWLVMTFTSNDNAIYRNEVNQLTVSLKYYFDNETKEIHEYDGEFDLPLDVTFYNAANKILAKKKLVNGVATLDYKPQDNDTVVYAKINNQELNITDFKSGWPVMTLTSNDTAIYRNEVNQLTVSLKYYFYNGTNEIHEYDGKVDIPLDVTFYTNTGTLTTKKLVNGVATLDYKPQDKDTVVYAKINNQILIIDDFKLRESKIVVNDFEKYYGSSSKLSVKLVKANNVPISNEQLTVSIGGKAYTVKTDKNGMVKLTLKNSPKQYTVKINFKGTKYIIKSTKSAKVKIVKPTIKASKLTIRKKGKFVVTFKDAHKKAIKNVKVKFKIKGKTYIRTTNSKGQTKITINLKAGKKYTVKVGFKSTKYYGTTTLTKKIKVIK